MITGIGTPKSQSRIPLPIEASSIPQVREDNAEADGWFPA
jgi:hypothetical protein